MYKWQIFSFKDKDEGLIPLRVKVFSIKQQNVYEKHKNTIEN